KTSKAIRDSNPQIFSNIIQVVENQIHEDNPKKRGQAINEQIKAMSNLGNPTGNNEYNQEAMSVAISRNLEMKDGQALIDYVGTIETYKEIIKEGQIKLKGN